MKRFLTDSYAKWGNTPVSFGGRVENAPEMAEKAFSRLPVKEGGAPIVFAPVTKDAIDAASAVLGAEYKAGEGFILIIKKDGN